MSGDVPTVVPVAVPGGRDYTVVVEAGSIDRVGSHAREAAPDVRRWAIVGDDTVSGLYADRVRASFEAAGLPASVFAFPAGEANKNRAVWAELTDRLLADGLGRDGGVVGLGGGVSGDLAGFVAATYMRGVPVLQVPTSVVAMVDSAVGGKTGVDAPAGKNLVGAFHPPVRVVVDPTTIATLPVAERIQGLAEAVKHGAIVDAEYARAIERDAEKLRVGALEPTTRMVVRSIQVKAEVVSADERETGLRETLNFGHTIGHALEAASGFALPHGSAVALGMVFESRLGEVLGWTTEGTARELAGILERVGLPVAPAHPPDVERILEFVRADKKVRGGRPRIVFLRTLGRVDSHDGGWARAVEEEALRALLIAA
ncbi:MAG: 3-dehydroquinate synthase [Gemmatimonadetes bacterium]|nr:3-dehydroquinate synthase [Gemmatimonadota bacterium]